MQSYSMSIEFVISAEQTLKDKITRKSDSTAVVMVPY